MSLLQELTSNAVLNYRPDVVEYLAKKFNLNHLAKSHKSKKIRFTESVGIYSKHKFVDYDDSTINSRRGIQFAAISLNGKNCDFASVHLSSPVVNPKAYFEECDEFIERIKNIKKRTIFGGDLNSKRDADVVKRIDKLFNLPNSSPVTWHTRLPVNIQFDYIFTTKDL